MAVAALILLASIAAPRAARAQPPSESAAIERTIPTDVQQKSAAPGLSVPAPPPHHEVVDHRRFTLGAVNIDGATVFSQQQLSRYFEPYLATEIDAAKLAQIADAITAQYRRAGYVLSYAAVPSQDVQAGMVRLTVIEGRIGNISVDGVGPVAERAMVKVAAPLLRGGPLKEAILERAIGLIRDFSGIKVTDIALVRSDIEAGLYDLRITAVPARTTGFVYFDNRGTDSIARSRLYSSISFSSLGVEGDQVRVDLFTMPGTGSRYLYGQILGSVPLGRSRSRFAISAARSDQYLRASGHFDGRTANVSATVSHPFLRTRALTILGNVSLTDWSTEGTQRGAQLLRDRLRVVRLGLELTGEGTTRFQGQLLVSRGLGFGGMTKMGDRLASRLDASGLFTKASFSLQASRPLGELITLRANVIGQYADRPLLAEETFSLGGNRVGRAFKFNELTGDRGIGGGLEVSYRLGHRPKDRAGNELFAFVDGGITADVGSSVVRAHSYSLASAGAGIRFTLKTATISIEAGIPVRGSRDHSPHLFVSAFHSF